MTSDSRIAAARKITTNVRERDTDEELPTSRDTWPGEFDPEEAPTDTIPTPPPSSGLVDHVTIPALPAVTVDEEG